MLSTYLSKTKFKIDEKFNAKDIYIQNNGIWIHTVKGHRCIWNLLNLLLHIVPFKNWLIQAFAMTLASEKT